MRKEKTVRYLWSLLILPLSLLAADTVSLFDGKTLNGWEVVKKDKQYWRVEDGTIIADSLGKKMPRNTFLFSAQEYDNFEFRCLFRLTGDPKTGLVNSGIQFRTEMLAKGKAKGYQADIGEPKWWGCIYDEHRRGLIAKSDVSKLKRTLKPFGWNEYVIHANGPVLTLFINGIQTVQYIEKDPKIPAKGRFALQLHSGGICQIAYKEITLKPLTYDGPGVPTLKAANTPLAKDEVMFADFESGTYDGWTVAGNAFGKAPVKISDIPSYQGDVNARGSYCVNSHASALGELGQRDRATGLLTSAPFTVTHTYIRFLIGGGAHANQTCVNLISEGQQLHTASGSSNNKMAEAYFDVSKHKGKTVQLQIVDKVSGGWGNIGVDDIVFTNAKPKVAKVRKPARRKKKTQSERTKAWTPEAQLRGFTVPEGFVVELVASEKDGVINPIDLTFDDAGRLWTNTAGMYPLDPNPKASWGETLKYMDNPDMQWADERFRTIKEMYQGKQNGTDKILIIEDPTSAPKPATVWADGMTIPQSFLPYKNGAFIAHGSEMLFLEDTDNDGKADKWNTVLSGFGYTDTHTMSHLLVRAPGGWVHYAHGALNKGNVVTVKTGETDRVDYAKTGRFSLDGGAHDVLVAGLNNIWGHTLRGNGQWFGSEANDHGHSVTPMEPGTGYKGIGNAKIRSYQPQLTPPHKFRVGGTGLSGLAFADDTAEGFPAKWRDLAFLANPISCKINVVRVVRNPDGTVTSELLEDFLDSKDDWFRPVNMQFGPDGCLYVADFYNKIISHNEVAREHPDRDKTHGRIWRIRYTGAKPPKTINFYTLPAEQLPAQLKSPILWAKRAAWHQIVDRSAKQLAPAVAAICGDESQDETTRILALWSLEGLKHYDGALMRSLLISPLGDLRREAVRAMGNMPVQPAELAARLTPFLAEKNVMVRSQVLRTLADYGKASPALIDLAVGFCLPDSKSQNLGGDYERKFERYLARMALEKYPRELDQYLSSALAAKQPTSHLEWAAKALSIEARAKAFLATWPTIKDKPLSAEHFITACGLLRSPQVVTALTPVLAANGSEYLVTMANEHFAQIASPQLAKMLKPACLRMLTSGDADQARTAAIAADRLTIDGLDAAMAGLLPGKGNDPAFTAAAVHVLARAPTAHLETIKSVLAADRGAAAHIAALAALAAVDAESAKLLAPKVAKGLPAASHAGLAHRLSGSTAGARLVLDLLDAGTLSKALVDRTLVARVAASTKGDQRTAGLLQDLQAARAAQVKEAHKNLARFLPAAAKKNTNLATGGALFAGLCLSCHSVGGKGAGFAPALDGSAHRNSEHLLTAILDPDAAIEGNYTAYRVFKHDGSAVQGYLAREDASGVALRFMGGGEMVISRADIASSGFRSGRSVMPAGLIDAFSPEQVADLLAFIRTLK